MNRESLLGIVLSATSVGEYDKRLVILTKERGRIAAFAKGARRPQSPLLGCSQPFSFGEFTLYVGRSSYNVSSAEITNSFLEVRENLDATFFGCYFCEFVEYYTRENMAAGEELKLLYQTLRALGKGTIPHDLVRYIFELRMMRLIGEEPAVFNCASCGREDELNYFVSRAHGLCDSQCANNYARTEQFPVSATTRYTLQFILTSPLEKLYTFHISEKAQEELGALVTNYVKYQNPHEFHSLEALQRLNTW